jgi:hypothetical protein
LLVCSLETWEVSVGAVVCFSPELRILVAFRVEGEGFRGVGDVAAGEDFPEHAAKLQVRQR